MGTIPERPEEKERFPTHEELIAWVEGSARTVVAGNEVGAVRRIILYAIVGACLLAAGPVGMIGVIALLLLATTDDLR